MTLQKSNVIFCDKREENVKWLLFLLFCAVQCQAEGFCSGTLVKISDDYTSIENLQVGDRVICYDTAKNHVEELVSNVIKKSIDQYVRIHVADEYIRVACDQLLYDDESATWITAASLKTGDVLAGRTITVELINEPSDVYLISVAQYHNFFVSSLDICTHNFVPAVIIGISVFFGGGGLEVAGVTAGVAGLGGYLGYKWHKKNKQKHDIVLQPVRFDSTQEIEDIYYTDDAQAPGMPTENDGFYPPKKWDGKKVKNPNGPGYGWPDKKGSVWIPTGPNGHGCPHWDVEHPDGSYDNVVPGGRIRGKK